MIDRRVITDVELNRFVSRSHYVHYMKTAMWGAFKQKTENSTYHCLGFFEDDVLCAFDRSKRAARKHHGAHARIRGKAADGQCRRA